MQLACEYANLLSPVQLANFTVIYNDVHPFGTYVYVFLALDYPAPQLLNFGCTLIRYHVEFARSAIENVLICGLFTSPDSQERRSGHRYPDN